MLRVNGKRLAGTVVRSSARSTTSPAASTSQTIQASPAFPPSYAEHDPSKPAEIKNDFFGEQEFLHHHFDGTVDTWMTSFRGLGSSSFSEETRKALMAPIVENDIEVKPDGLLYLPEIKYRRILNGAFGPGGWGLVPRGPHSIIGRTLTREYGLVVNSCLISVARGEQDFFSPDSLPTATEGVKSNALMRCCKDLGVVSELWDPVFIRKWKSANAVDVWVTDLKTKQKRKLWRRKDERFGYPYEEAN